MSFSDVLVNRMRKDGSERSSECKRDVSCYSAT